MKKLLLGTAGKERTDEFSINLNYSENAEYRVKHVAAKTFDGYG